MVPVMDILIGVSDTVTSKHVVNCLNRSCFLWYHLLFVWHILPGDAMQRSAFFY